MVIPMYKQTKSSGVLPSIIVDLLGLHKALISTITLLSGNTKFRFNGGTQHIGPTLAIELEKNTQLTLGAASI